MSLIQKFRDGRTDLIFELLQSGYQADAKDEHGTALIRWCAYYGDVSGVKYLVEKGAKLTLLGDNYDLNGAAYHGHWQLCQYLLEQGADPNWVNPENGETILHGVLAHTNRPADVFILKLLLSYGATVNVRTQPNKESGAFMRDAYTKRETPLHRAAAFGSEEMIQLLLDAGADKAIKDLNGDSPLSWASWHKRPGSILAMLTYGEHRIHPLHVKNMQSDHGWGYGAGMSIMRMGELHLKDAEAG